jgi:monoamine oxidase
MERLDCDTVILGAGMSGLAAGRILAQSGLAVTMLEARNRVGGRLLTQHVAAGGSAGAFAVELGAEFIHGLPLPTWTIVREAGLQTYELIGLRLRFLKGQLQPNDAQEDSVLNRMIDWVATHPNDSDMPFTKFLATVPIDRRAWQGAIAYVEGFNAADSNVIGIAALAKQQQAEDKIESDRLFRIRDGYDALPKFLAAMIEQAAGVISYEACAQRIEWRRGAVTVSGTRVDGEAFAVHARRALITLPLGVLHAGTVEFSPAPRDILSQARRLAMGPVVRATLAFSHRFWQDKDSELRRLSFLFAPDDLPPTWWTASPDSAPTITGWVGGTKVAAMTQRFGIAGGENAMLIPYLQVLARIFGTTVADLETLLTGWYTHDWQRDEFTRGAYSYAPAGALDASEKMAQPVDGTLYFAGEHTDITGHWGTVHGAIASGMRAAAQVLTDASTTPPA